MFENSLPVHPNKKYNPVGKCIYCGAKGNLNDEHIIPLGLGGRWILPDSSCAECAAITAKFEGVCLRTIFGPLRLYYDLPSRRRKSRPKTLPLKIKQALNLDWENLEVDQNIYPFLVLFPYYLMPDELSGFTAMGRRDSSAKHFWIRGASFRHGFNVHMEQVAHELGVAAIQPTANFSTPEFCLMLAKIAHSYSIAEIGTDSFSPFLTSMILNIDTSNRAQYIGGLRSSEPRSANLHEISFNSHTCSRPDIVAVRVRLLATLETPTYFIAVGRRR